MAPDTASVPMIEISDLGFGWNGHEPLLAIENVRIERGERVFVEGPSGSGKSTLLSLIAGVLTPQAGSIRVSGMQVSSLNGAHKDRFRADHIGIIYQMFNLLPYLSIIENVTLPCRFSASRRSRAAAHSGSFEAEAVRLLKELGLDDMSLMRRAATELSVGQQQRVAAARALIGSPEIIMADEPTSSLDMDRRKAFIELLFKETTRERTTLIFVSHDSSLESLFDRAIRLAEINSIKQAVLN